MKYFAIQSMLLNFESVKACVSGRAQVTYCPVFRPFAFDRALFFVKRRDAESERAWVRAWPGRCYGGGAVTFPDSRTTTG